MKRKPRRATLKLALRDLEAAVKHEAEVYGGVSAAKEYDGPLWARWRSAQAHRDALTVRAHLDGATLTEMADILGVTSTVVSKRIHEKAIDTGRTDGPDAWFARVRDYLQIVSGKSADAGYIPNRYSSVPDVDGNGLAEEQ